MQAGTFDTVVDTFGLCSFEDPEQSLTNIARMAKPDGTVLLLEHGLGTWDFINNILNRNAEKHAKKWGCIYNRDIGKIVASAGLKVVEQRRCHLGTTYLYVCKRDTKLT